MTNISILIINPNSSKVISDNLEKILTKVDGIDFHFYTAPPAAPKEIDGIETSLISESVVLPDLVNQKILDKCDGILVGCYSDHPLIHSLSKHTSKPVLGIMQATLTYALSSNKVSKSFILTSFGAWESILDKGITDFVGTESFPTKKFLKTKALNINVLNLNDPQEYRKIEKIVERILNKDYVDEGVNCILLGCAGMATLDSKLSKSFPGIIFVDGVKIGVEVLLSLIRCQVDLA